MCDSNCLGVPVDDVDIACSDAKFNTYFVCPCMSLMCHWFMYLYDILCTCVSLVCHSYVVVCHSYVNVCLSYMTPVCICMTLRESIEFMFRKNNMDNRECYKFHAELLRPEYGDKKKTKKKTIKQKKNNSS